MGVTLYRCDRGAGFILARDLALCVHVLCRVYIARRDVCAPVTNLLVKRCVAGASARRDRAHIFFALYGTLCHDEAKEVCTTE